MPIVDTLRFRFLDLGKLTVFTFNWFSCRVAGWTGLRTPVELEIPGIGHKVEFSWKERATSGWFVPHTNSHIASVLLFHGIGDRNHYWRRAQQVMADAGISSLVFDFPGYGESDVPSTRDNMEDIARTAYLWLRSRMPNETPVFLLGFSLGSGLAAEVAQTLDPLPNGVILSEAFSSLQDAAKRAARPLPVLGYLLPDVWKTRENVAGMTMPLLIIHSDGDSLFPVSMAEELHTAARMDGVQAELRVLHGYKHDAPYRIVPQDYWAEILLFIQKTSGQRRD